MKQVLPTEDILGKVRVASPCKASWERMEGDERVRHCELCRKNVYNLSGMTRQEAESLVAGAEGKVCVRFYRRSDGTMLTQDCPVGLMAMRKRMATTLACAATFLLSAYAYASNLAHRRPVEPTNVEKKSVYEQAREIEPFRIILDRLNPPPTMGKPVSISQPTMGAVAFVPSKTIAPVPEKPAKK